jgi:hypothetical protein
MLGTVELGTPSSFLRNVIRTCGDESTMNFSGTCPHSTAYPPNVAEEKFCELLGMNFRD